MSRVIDEATASDSRCRSCGDRGYTIFFPIAPGPTSPYAYLCALCLASIVDKALDFNWRRNLEVSLASKRLGEELTPRTRTQKRAR